MSVMIESDYDRPQGDIERKSFAALASTGKRYKGWHRTPEEFAAKLARTVRTEPVTFELSLVRQHGKNKALGSITLTPFAK